MLLGCELDKLSSRYGFEMEDPNAKAALILDAWTGGFASRAGEDIRRRHRPCCAQSEGDTEYI